jgi:hypothetical protein
VQQYFLTMITRGKSAYLKAVRKGDREAELAFEHGWKCRHKIHRSKKTYTRKVKFRKHNPA